MVAPPGHPLATEATVEAEGPAHSTDEGVVGESTCGGAEQDLKLRSMGSQMVQEMHMVMTTHLQDVRNGCVKLCEYDAHLVEVRYAARVERDLSIVVDLCQRAHARRRTDWQRAHEIVFHHRHRPPAVVNRHARVPLRERRGRRTGKVCYRRIFGRLVRLDEENDVIRRLRRPHCCEV